MARFDAKAARVKALAVEQFKLEAIRRLMVRPFDIRWCYYTPTRPIWNEPRPLYVEQCWPGNHAFVTRRKGVASPEGVPFFFTSAIGAQHGLNTDAYYMPVRIRTAALKRAEAGQTALVTEPPPPRANISPAIRRYLKAVGIGDSEGDEEAAGLVWKHALAVGYSPAYLSENADGIRQNWPRIPLPHSKEILLASATLGKQIADMLDTEAKPEFVREPALQKTGIVSRVGGGDLREKDEGDLKSELAVTAGWGHAGQGGVTMPGKGKLVERDYTGPEREAIVRGGEARGMTAEQTFQTLGALTYDVYLNEVAYWSNIPIRAWEYTIGGYQVIKKWLSYREETLLGRALNKEEARYVQEMARRIAAILLLEPTLDSNYRNVKEHTFPWNE